MKAHTIVFFGTPAFAVPVLIALQKNFTVKGVVTAPDAAVGRKMVASPSPVKAWAQSQALPVFTPSSLRHDAAFIAAMQSIAPDFLVVFSYGKILPASVLAMPKIAAINLHPSRLPHYRGPSPIQAQILAGESAVGLSVMQMVPQMDAGPIYQQTTFPLSPTDTFASTIDRAAELGAALLVTVIQQFASLTPTAQNESAATYTPIITKHDGFLPVDELAATNAALLDRMIRAYFPWPTVWTEWHGTIIKLLPQQRIQVSGKAAVSVRQFLNGHTDAATWLAPIIEKIEK